VLGRLEGDVGFADELRLTGVLRSSRSWLHLAWQLRSGAT
jgi:hypothetical protein